MSLGLALRDAAPVVDVERHGERETVLGVLLCYGCTRNLRNAASLGNRVRLCVTCKPAIAGKWDPVTRRWRS